MKGTSPVKTYEHVVQAVFGQPWMIRQNVLEQIAQLVRIRSAGGAFSQEEVQARIAAAAGAAGPRGGARTLGAVGIIPIYGTIFPRANIMTEISGGATVSGIRTAFRQALADESIGSILFDIDSPGGMVDGIEELATEILEARGRKPMVSIADYMMASAAVWLGSSADEMVVSPSAMVGWVGAVAVHTEYSKADEMAGVTHTVIRHPEGKYGGNEYEPLSEKARAELQQMVEDYGTKFETQMAKARGVSVSVVRNSFGQGGGMTAARAKAAGLVDRVETFDQVVQRLATGKVVSRGTSARAVAGESLTPLNMATLEQLAAAGVTRNSLLAIEGERPDDAEPGEQAADDTSGLSPAVEPEPLPPIDPPVEAPIEADSGEQHQLDLLRLKHRTRSR